MPFFCTQKCALSPTDQLVMETPLESRFWNNIPRGILFTEGSKWSAQRKFSPKTLKDFKFEHQRVNPFKWKRLLRISSQSTTTTSSSVQNSTFRSKTSSGRRSPTRDCHEPMKRRNSRLKVSQHYL